MAGTNNTGYQNFRTGSNAHWTSGTRGSERNNISRDSGDINGSYQQEFVANLIDGGQLGYGFKAGAFDAATPLAFPPAHIVVLQTPMMWNSENLGDDGVLAMTLKSMFECHAKSVTGIDVNYTLDTGDQPVGHDGQTFKVPTQSKRAEVSPSFTWPEVTGNLVWNIIKRWIWDIQNPDTNAGMEFMATPLPYTMSAYSLTFMAIQFDQTMHPDRIIDASIYCNVFPQATGEMGIQRTIGTTEVKERAVTFNAYLIHNQYTKYLGREVAKILNMRSETYQFASPNVQTIDPMFVDGGDSNDPNARHFAGLKNDRDLAVTDNVDATVWQKKPYDFAPTGRAQDAEPAARPYQLPSGGQNGVPPARA